jgi:hypothetical protein
MTWRAAGVARSSCHKHCTRVAEPGPSSKPLKQTLVPLLGQVHEHAASFSSKHMPLLVSQLQARFGLSAREKPGLQSPRS